MCCRVLGLFSSVDINSYIFSYLSAWVHQTWFSTLDVQDDISFNKWWKSRLKTQLFLGFMYHPFSKLRREREEKIRLSKHRIKNLSDLLDIQNFNRNSLVELGWSILLRLSTIFPSRLHLFHHIRLFYYEGLIKIVPLFLISWIQGYWSLLPLYENFQTYILPIPFKNRGGSYLMYLL